MTTLSPLNRAAMARARWTASSAAVGREESVVWGGGVGSSVGEVG